MNYYRPFCVLLVSAVLLSCKQENSRNAEENAANSEIAPATESQMASSSAAVESKNPDRKFIRTAELKFKVKNVAQSTYSIENTVSKFNGFVTSTELRSIVNNTTTTKVSSDSLIETTRFNVENAMVIRVPNTALDTTLKTIARQIDYLDYRIIKADDVSLQLLSNQLSQKRNAANQQRVTQAIQNRGKKLGETLDAEDRLHESQTESDDAQLSNRSLNDQVSYSTLSLFLYQKEAVRHEKIANPENEKFRTGLGIRFTDGLRNGWYMLESLLVFLSNLWALLVIAIVGWLLYRKFKKPNV